MKYEADSDDGIGGIRSDTTHMIIEIKSVSQNVIK